MALVIFVDGFTLTVRNTAILKNRLTHLSHLCTSDGAERKKHMEWILPDLLMQVYNDGHQKTLKMLRFSFGSVGRKTETNLTSLS